MKMRHLTVCFLLAGLAACGTTENRSGTLAELDKVPPDLDEVYLDDSLERAAQSYRRYLEETSESARTPEAMRRLADLQIEQAYGVLGSGEMVEMAAPETAAASQVIEARRTGAAPSEPTESELEFEERATRESFLTQSGDYRDEILGENAEAVPAGPREAIATYQKILDNYPDYERNDKVLYQMSRAYDEIGEPDAAMEVMDRLVREYPHSRFVDEVQFRRGEYFFVRKKYINAEDAYGAVITMGPSSSYYELALYKKGWTLYKQFFYEDALDNFMAMLDHRRSIGFDFDAYDEDDDEHRIADTFRVISLSFSNMGDVEAIDDYFARTGQRSYADKIYESLGEFYFTKLRYEDAASVYKSFIGLNPYHEVSPHFGMRVIEIYGEAGFPLLVVESKKEFATQYALGSTYWNYVDIESSADVVEFLRTNLTDLAGHYHALYQTEGMEEQKPVHFDEAQRWYRQLLASFPSGDETPGIHYQLADLLLENGDFADAAIEFERTAYEYPGHEKSSAAGYAAVFAHRENLKIVTGARQRDVKELTVESSLRFAETFGEHEQAPIVLGAAADDLYEMEDFPRAIDSARKLIERYPASDRDLRRSAWAVIAHSSMDTAEYPDAEHAYAMVLELTEADDEARPAVIENLAAAIYKQGEQANVLEDYQAAAGHFLRVKTITPTSTIRSAAEYDAAAALMKLSDWTAASSVLEDFRETHPEHELNADATKQLAYIYREDGQIARSAAEHERIAAEASDPDLSREALLTAGEMYDEVHAMDDAVRVYEQYVDAWPLPLDLAMQTRTRLSEIYRGQSDFQKYFDELNEIVEKDREAGPERTDRSRFLASKAALVLSERTFEQFERTRLTQPFEESLALKRQQMDDTLVAMEGLVSYEVAEVTAAATYYIAEVYLEFSASLLESERPEGMSAAEANAYELVLEEEAYPFEERGIEVHEANFELLASGIYNSWVQKSLDDLAELMPGRYAKRETSEGYLGANEIYAYVMPIAVPPPIDEGAVEAGSGADSASVDPVSTQSPVVLSNDVGVAE